MMAVNQECQACSATWKCRFSKATSALQPNLGFCLMKLVTGLLLILLCSREDYYRSVIKAQGSVFAALYYLQWFNIGAVPE